MSNPIVARTYFGEIAKKLASGDLIASCNQLIETDRASSAALVRPLMANQIYLGESFWNYPTIGNYKGTSQASIIVHEVSHFIDVAGTTDVFGISSYEDAHDFALFMPGNAPFVALSYQYFAENDPFKQ